MRNQKKSTKINSKAGVTNRRRALTHNPTHESSEVLGILHQPKKSGRGFSLIELMVVISIIALLSSVALIALMSARQKARDAKRLADMTQMATAMQLYFNTNYGYPSATNGDPGAVLVPTYLAHMPSTPQPPDGSCDGLAYPNGGTGSGYYYYPSPTGGAYLFNGISVYPDFLYYFCLGNQTGNFSAGMHYVSPKGVR